MIYTDRLSEKTLARALCIIAEAQRSATYLSPKWFGVLMLGGHRKSGWSYGGGLSQHIDNNSIYSFRLGIRDSQFYGEGGNKSHSMTCNKSRFLLAMLEVCGWIVMGHEMRAPIERAPHVLTAKAEEFLVSYAKKHGRRFV